MEVDTLKILHLHKSSTIQSEISKVLKNDRLCFEIKEVNSEENFIAALGEFVPDIILATGNTPPFGSKQALGIVKASGRRFPFIEFTPNASAAYVREAFRNGVDDLLLDLRDLPKAFRATFKKDRELLADLMENSIGGNSAESIMDREEKNSSLFLNSADAILIGDHKGNIFAANPSACDIFQMTEKEICRLGRKGLVDSSDSRLQSILDDRERVGKGNAEVRLLRKNGSSFPGELTSAYYLNSKGEKRASVIIKDISERKRVEAELLKSRKDYRNLFQLSPLPNWIYDVKNLKILDVNQTALDHYGYSREEFLQLTLLDLRPKEEISTLRNYLKQNDYNEKSVHYSRALHKKKDGTRMTMEIYGYRLNFGVSEARLIVAVDISEKVQAQEQLLESNTRYKLASKATFDAIWDLDMEKGQLDWSESYYSLFGHEKRGPERERELWEQHIYHEDRERVIKGLEMTLKGKIYNWKENYRYRTGNGEYAWVIDRGLILRDENGRAVRMVGALQDVSEKKKLEELLDNANSLSRTGSFEIDLVRQKVYWSSIIKEIHEVEPDFEPDFENIFKFLEEGKRKGILEIFLRSARENIAYDFETEITTAKNKKVWVRFIGQPEWIDGTCIRIKGSLQDITKLKKSELEALKAFEEKENILETIGDGFFAVNEDWQVTYCNRQAEIFLGFPKEKVLGRNLWERFPDAVGTEFYYKFQKGFENRENIRVEYFYQKTGVWYDFSAYPGPNGIVVYFRDISERKKNELKILQLNKDLQEYTKELVTANKGLEQFSYIVSHNLRSPVANILGLAEIIQMGDQPQETIHEMQREIVNNVKRLDQVIVDLNSILQVKKENNEQRERVDVKEIIDSIKASLGHLLKKEQVEIHTDFSKVSELTTIKSYFYSIFFNLISNSIKYRQPEFPPVITIRSDRKDGKLFFSFQDNGLGIDLPRRKDQLFGLYKRFHSHVQGKGMGLFMVKTQVEMLGGKISVTSKLNCGTTFTIEFEDENIGITYSVAFHSKK